MPATRGIGVALAITILVGCDGSLPPPFGEPTLPIEARRVRVSDAALNEDSKTLNVTFVGGAEFSRVNGCSVAYDARAASESDDVLAVEVFSANPPGHGPDPGVACGAIGFERRIAIPLETAFEGTRVHDLTGSVLFVRRPDGLWELTGLPDDWTLRLEDDVEDSPSGRWRRVYAVSDLAAEDPSMRLELYQAFGSPMSISGGQTIDTVRVGGNPATLYRSEPGGELVLVWRPEADGLALVAFEDQFSVEELIRLAESVEPPAEP